MSRAIRPRSASAADSAGAARDSRNSFDEPLGAVAPLRELADQARDEEPRDDGEDEPDRRRRGVMCANANSTTSTSKQPPATSSAGTRGIRIPAITTT